mmetsp:Transcript_163665/g.524822  ORF Transcript_163665/g.524822 Transcript_163665/m.524822 type:complete len:451 (-) Transcript_163665:2041-3393(-)
MIQVLVGGRAGGMTQFKSIVQVTGNALVSTSCLSPAVRSFTMARVSWPRASFRAGGPSRRAPCTSCLTRTARLPLTNARTKARVAASKGGSAPDTLGTTGTLLARKRPRFGPAEAAMAEPQVSEKARSAAHTSASMASTACRRDASITSRCALASAPQCSAQARIPKAMLFNSCIVSLRLCLARFSREWKALTASPCMMRAVTEMDEAPSSSKVWPSSSSSPPLVLTKLNARAGMPSSAATLRLKRRTVSKALTEKRSWRSLTFGIPRSGKFTVTSNTAPPPARVAGLSATASHFTSWPFESTSRTSTNSKACCPHSHSRESAVSASACFVPPSSRNEVSQTREPRFSAGRGDLNLAANSCWLRECVSSPASAAKAANKARALVSEPLSNSSEGGTALSAVLGSSEATRDGGANPASALPYREPTASRYVSFTAPRSGLPVIVSSGTVPS